MLTTCTECGTRFRLSAEQLRQAEGQVRCGRCGEVFDAFTHLHGDDGTPWSVPIDDEADAKSTQPLPRDPDPVEETGAEAGAETDDVLGDTDDLPVNPAGRIEPRMDDLFGDLEPEYAAPETLPDLEQEADASDALAQELGTLEAESEPDSLPDTELPPHDHLIAHPDRQRHRLLWSIGVAVLALLLFAQWVNANRQMLSRNLVIGPSLSALYSLLGRPLAAPLALDAWQISNTNVTSDPDAADGLSITGS
ncbi:MAG: zinc-ribbon domain-containing protein, partial [Gammaproteobacteria bacterium]